LKLPSFLTELIDFVREHGLNEEGIFRLTVPQSELSGALRRVEVGAHILEPTDSPHMAASIIKRFLRMLPESLLTDELKDSFLAIADSRSDDTEKLRENINKLPLKNKVVLENVMHLAYDVHCLREKNLMGSENLGVVFGPVLFVNKSSNPLGALDATASSVQLASIMISHFPEVFLPPKPIFHPPSSLPADVMLQVRSPVMAHLPANIAQQSLAVLPSLQLLKDDHSQSTPRSTGQRSQMITASHSEVLLPNVMPTFPNPEVERTEMMKYAELIFNKYRTGSSSFMCEIGFCCFLEHLSMIQGFRVFPQDFRVNLYASLAPQRQLDFSTFAEWLVANYRSLYSV